MKIIILISGLAGAGKSTFASFLQEHLKSNGWSVYKASFACKIKEIVGDYFNWDGEKDDKGRKLLQSLGNCGREYNENLWVEWVINDIDTEKSDFVIIDDWRFPNESKLFEDFEDFKVIKIRIVSSRDTCIKGKLSNDISEVSLPKYVDPLYDFIISNNSSLEELFYLAMIMSNNILDDYRDLFESQEC